MSHAENLNGFNVPEQTPNQKKDKKQVSRRGLLIGLGAGATALIGGGAAAGSYFAGRGNKAPAPDPVPKTPVETETPTETEAPVETDNPTGELEAPSYEDLTNYQYPDQEIGGFSHDVSKEEITEYFKLTEADIAVGNEEQVEAKINQALELMLNGSPRTAQLVIDAEDYAKNIMGDNENGEYDKVGLAIEYFKGVAYENALAVIDGLAGDDWMGRDRVNNIQKTLDAATDYGYRSLANWYVSGFTGFDSAQDMYQQFYDNEPRPELFEFTVEPRSTDTREVSIDTKIESEFNIRAVNMRSEDSYVEIRDQLFEPAGEQMGVEVYVDQAASDEAGYVAVSRITLLNK